MIKLIAADMDGTLLDSNKRLPARLPAVMEALKKRGVRFAAASGRSHFNLHPIFGTLADDMIFICDNGALAYENKTLLFDDPIPAETAAAVADGFRLLDGAYCLLCGGKNAYVEPVADAEMKAYIDSYYPEHEVVESLTNVVEHDSVYEITICARDAAQLDCSFLKRFSGLSTRLSGELWIDITNETANKGTAIRRLESLFGITPDEVMSFGDHYNDIEMLECCAHSYAMANGVPEAKAAARFLAKSNDEDGVCDAIIHEFHLEGEIG